MADVTRLGVLTAEEVADTLGFDRSTVVRWCREGELPFASKVGRRWFIAEDQLRAWLTGGNRDERATS